MRKSLLSIALGAALVLPAAGAVTAAQAAPAKVFKYGQMKRFEPTNKLALRRCMLPIKVVIGRERSRLRRMRYRNIRLTSVYQYRPRCAQHVRFTACRGTRRYEFEIRYRNGRRIQAWRYPRGRCFIRYRNRRGS